MKRITISIPDELLRWIEENIRKRRFHNYQHAVEYCLYREMANDASAPGAEAAPLHRSSIRGGRRNTVGTPQGKKPAGALGRSDGK